MIVGVIRAGEIAAAIVLGRRLNVVKRHGVFVDNDVAHDRDVAVTLEERSDARLHDGRPFAIRIDDGWCHHHSIIALSRSDLNLRHLTEPNVTGASLAAEIGPVRRRAAAALKDDALQQTRTLEARIDHQLEMQVVARVIEAIAIAAAFVVRTAQRLRKRRDFVLRQIVDDDLTARRIVK